ncbi:MAG: polysaccharide deacetylase family protein [Alphaproteobacteria bacterium]|nr:polysaccharide deacetylase family protein [Alphaproteobacteria bacterium]
MPQIQHAADLTGWDAFHAELDAWKKRGRIATFWWRDDDATRMTPALTRLLDIADETPISLAVIPHDATAELADALNTRPHATVLQHGFAHLNHAPSDEKKAEFGAHRTPDAMRLDLIAGFKRIGDLFGARFRPMFVPPWNRMTNSLVPRLASVGFRAYSTYGATPANAAPPTAVTQINARADIINWRGGRRFLGETASLELLTTHLSQRRQGSAADQPTGLLTHHADHDDACWRFIETLLRVIKKHPATAWWAPTA